MKRKNKIVNGFSASVQFHDGEMKIGINPGDTAKEVSDQFLKLSRYVKLAPEDFSIKFIGCLPNTCEALPK